MSFGLAEQVGLVAHHVLHVALRHSNRQAALAERLGTKFDATLFGIAADGLINETLVLAGHAIPRPAILVTDLLQTIGETATSPMQALSEWDADRLAMALHSTTERSEKARKFGQSREFEQDLVARDAGSEEEAPSAADWRNQMIRALEAGRKAGTGIGRFGGILADLAAPRIPWEVHLRGLLATALSDTPTISFRRPASRWIAIAALAQATNTPEPVFQPGRSKDAFRPRVAVGLDTSSSIDATTLSLFWQEIEGVSRRSGAEVHLLAFDESVHVARRIDAGAWRSLRDKPMRTGGGTDYAPVFDAALRLQPSILVMLTDLDAPFGSPPPFPMLWVVPKREVKEVPFGRVIEVDT
ncbi:MAG: VWA-like domain-containing protein [Gymnodinialimonas sp.]